MIKTLGYNQSEMANLAITSILEKVCFLFLYFFVGLFFQKKIFNFFLIFCYLGSFLFFDGEEF